VLPVPAVAVGGDVIEWRRQSAIEDQQVVSRHQAVLAAVTCLAGDGHAMGGVRRSDTGLGQWAAIIVDDAEPAALQQQLKLLLLFTVSVQ